MERTLELGAVVVCIEAAETGRITLAKVARPSNIFAPAFIS